MFDALESWITLISLLLAGFGLYFAWSAQKTLRRLVDILEQILINGKQKR